MRIFQDILRCDLPGFYEAIDSFPRCPESLTESFDVMRSNDWSSREPPSLGQVRSDPSRADANSFDLQASYADRTLPPADAPPLAYYDDEPERGRGGIGRKLTYVFLAFAALIAIAVGTLALAPPVDMVRSHVAAEVERQTGRKLTVGSAGLSFASGVGVSLGDVTLSASRGMGGAPLLRSERIEVSLPLLSLVFGNPSIDRLTLVKPVIDLRVDEGGRRSWQSADRRGAWVAPIRFAQGGGTATDAAPMPSEVTDFLRHASPPRRRGGGFDALTLSDVRIVDGVVRYADARSGFVRELRGVDATASLPGVSGPLTLKGQATLAGDRVSVDLRIENMREFLADRSVGLRAALGGRAVEASFTGTVAGGARPLSEGKFVARSPSATRLAQVFGIPLDGLDRLGAVAIDGQLRATENSVMLSSAAFSAGPSSGTGTLGFDTSGGRPHVIANVRIDRLELDRIASVSWEPGEAPVAQEADPGLSAGRFAMPFAAKGTSDGPPASIGDLLGREDVPTAVQHPATRVKGFRQRLSNQWEVEPFEVDGLRKVDVEARIHVASLHTEKLSAENLQTGIELKGGVLRLTLADGRIGGGAVRGLVSVDARQPAMTVGVNLTGDNLAMKPLLALAGVDLVDGHGKLVLTVSAQGASERELVSTLAGRAEIKVADGALLGWDADAIVADLGRGRMPDAERNPAARTPFRQLSGNFHVSQGVARSRDLRLESHVVDAAGTATVNIVDRNVDITLKPRLGAGGLEVPVRIAGAWDAPRLVADLNGALKSRQAQDAVRNLKEGNVDGALRSVLGDGPKAEKKIQKAKELLQGILGR